MYGILNKRASPLIPLLRGTTICPPLAGVRGVDISCENVYLRMCYG